MCISRHQYILISLTLVNQHMEKLLYRLSDFFNLCTGKEFQIQQHLVIAWTPAMYLLSYVTQTPGQHQFHLWMYVFHSFFYHKFTFFGRSIYIPQLCQQLHEFLLCQQTDTFEHCDMSHRTDHIMFSQIKVHFAVTPYSETFDIFIHLYGFLPKFLCHKNKY